MSVEVIDFGCRLNLSEGATMRRELADEDDLIVVNTCAVTVEAERQARAAIRKAAQRRPEARIVVTGCAATTDRARLSAMPEVADVIAEKRKLMRSIGPAMSGQDHARAFVEVQNGCDHDCTFCVTTIARGPARSLDIEAVVDAIAARVDAGQQEVVLTGVDLTSYRPSLAALVAEILLKVPALPRLRLSSLDPAEVDDALFDLLAHEPRIMPHMHLSLQSGDAMILKRMKRRHTPQTAMILVDRLRSARSKVTIGADLIAGFPTETEVMHRNSMAIVEACDVAFGHVFPYSSRPGTAAARMPQVSPTIAKARAAELRATSLTQRIALFDAMIGMSQPVLIELAGDRGYAPNYAPVRLAEANPTLAGRIVNVCLAGHDGSKLIGVSA